MNIAVIFGGESCEHDISIITGLQLCANVNIQIHSVLPIYIDKVGNWLVGKDLGDIDNYPNFLGKTAKVALINNDNNLYIKKRNAFKKYQKIDFAFVCLHGLGGEDGTIAAILEHSKIPYSACSMMSSAVALDKAIFKRLLVSNNIKTAQSICLNIDDWNQDQDKCVEQIGALSEKVIIKPARQGSSIGIQISNSQDDIVEKINKAFKFDNKLLIEEFLNVKKEINIALFKHKTEMIFSQTEEPQYSSEILGFDEKYRKNSGGFQTIKRICPAKISKKIEDDIKTIADSVYNKLDMFGVVRFDFILDQEDNLYLNEVNTIPGSMANYLFEDITYSKLIDMIILNGLIRFEKEKERAHSFDSGVLLEGIDSFKK